jgi:HK97 family phage prohead protease
MNKHLETRTAQVQLRAAGDFVLEGIAAGYGTVANIAGQYRETIAPGAFAASLAAGDDVCCFFNHNHDIVLGRTKAGTLTLRDTDAGLSFRCQLDARNTDHQNVYAMVQRGDTDQCSFAFSVPDGGDVWAEMNDRRGPLRTLRNITLHDVSVVTYPAYQQGTSVAARNTDADDAARIARAQRQAQEIDAYNRRRAAELGVQIAKER